MSWGARLARSCHFTGTVIAACYEGGFPSGVLGFLCQKDGNADVW
jgi:hypothetical protein